MKKSLGLLISLLVGVALFLSMLPLHFDRYIPTVHSVISVILTALSCLLFSVVIYKFINKTLLSHNLGILLYFLVALGIAHGIYTVMFYSSWICLAIILVILLVLAILYFRNKRKK